MQTSIIESKFNEVVYPQARDRRLSGAQIRELEKMFFYGAEFVLSTLTEKPHEQGLIYDEVERHSKRVEEEFAKPNFNVRPKRED